MSSMCSVITATFIGPCYQFIRKPVSRKHLEMAAFEEMGVLPELAKAVEEMEWTLPTDVQNEAIPAILGGGDVLMAAETGSGKTGAFCLPVLQIVWETLKDVQSGRSGGKGHGPNNKTTFNDWRLNVYDRGDAIAISADGLLCQSRDQQKWFGTRATKGVAGKGKYYYEATVTDDGLCRIGWSTLNATLDLGTDDQGFGYGGTGKKSFQRQFDDYGESYTLNDTIGAYLDLDNKEVSFARNGKFLGVAFRIPRHLDNAIFFPALVLKNAEIQFNFGAAPFKYPPTDGFVGLISTPADHIINSTITEAGSTAQVVPKKRSLNAPLCIIIEPSRELAEQTYKQIEKFKKYLDNPRVKNTVVVGGVPAKEQVAAIRDGVDIVTGTPGRLEEFISSGELDLSQVRFFILDEADGLLQQGYLDFINRLHAKMPKITSDGKPLQMVVCSATLHNFEVKKLGERLMRFPQWIDLKGEDAIPETVHHVVVMADPRTDKRWVSAQMRIETDKVHARGEIRPGLTDKETLSEGVKILKGEYIINAIREHKMDQGLIFCRTKLDCDNMESWLNKIGKGQFTCACLHSGRKPDERKGNLELFKTKKVKFLICTDVAARGIDITGVPFVINVTLPDDKTNYVHRIGRVGRAERMGLAISLVSAVPEKVWYHQCPSKGTSCKNTSLVENGGCTIWYNEPMILAEIEDHLNITIQQVGSDAKVQADEFDGKVVYGQKRQQTGTGYQGHAGSLSSAVSELAKLEKSVQLSFLKMREKPFISGKTG